MDDAGGFDMTSRPHFGFSTKQLPLSDLIRSGFPKGDDCYYNTHTSLGGSSIIPGHQGLFMWV